MCTVEIKFIENITLKHIQSQVHQIISNIGNIKRSILFAFKKIAPYIWIGQLGRTFQNRANKHDIVYF